MVATRSPSRMAKLESDPAGVGEDRPHALVIEGLTRHESGSLGGELIDAVELLERRTDAIRGRGPVEALDGDPRALGLVHVLAVLSLQPGAQRLLAGREIDDSRRRGLDLRGGAPWRLEQAGAICRRRGRLRVGADGGDPLRPAGGSEGVDHGPSHVGAVEVADRPARHVGKVPSDDRDAAQEQLRTGNRLVRRRSDGEANRSPPAHGSHLSPLPQLREGVVRRPLDERVPGSGVGDAEGAQLAGAHGFAHPAAASASRAAPASSQGRFSVP